MSILPNKDYKRKLLSREEERTLIRAAQSGNQSARDELIERNYGLCYKYAGRSIRPRWMDPEDLFTVAVLGLNHAIDKFDLDKPYKFSTYAVAWILQHINREVAKNLYAMHISSSMYEKIGKFLKTRAALDMKLGREPTAEELMKHGKFTEKDLELIEATIRPPVSTYLWSGDGDDSILKYKIDTIPDEENRELEVIDTARVEYLLSFLPQEQKELVEYTYGLMGKPKLTYAQIAERRGISRQRVQQLVKKCLIRLKEKLPEEILEEYNV